MDLQGTHTKWICPTGHLDKVDVAASEECEWHIGWQTAKALFLLFFDNYLIIYYDYFIIYGNYFIIHDNDFIIYDNYFIIYNNDFIFMINILLFIMIYYLW